MIPMQWDANIKIPFLGWFGETFSSKPEARQFVARMLRDARKNASTKPHYSSRSYWIIPRLLNEFDAD